MNTDACCFDVYKGEGEEGGREGMWVGGREGWREGRGEEGGRGGEGGLSNREAP